MSLSERSRSALFLGLVGTVQGERAVEEMLSYFPARDVEEPVSKEFLRAELAVQQAEVQAEFAAVRSEMADGFSAVRSEMGGVRSEMGDLGTGRSGPRWPGSGSICDARCTPGSRSRWPG